MKHVEVCPTPELVELYGVEGKVIVIIDILRATSCMTTAIAHGIKSIIPVATLEECKALQKQGFIAAAERDGKMAEGFDLGNSPFSYMDKALVGRTIAVTTTNGTQAIVKSHKAEEILIGSFLNKSSIVQYLKSQHRDILLVCAGWKGKMNLEDTLFAGAVIEGLGSSVASENDSAIAAVTLYQAAKKDMAGFLSRSSHVKRLNGLNIHKDILFCLTEDVYSVIPVLRGKELISMEVEVAEKPSTASL